MDDEPFVPGGLIDKWFNFKASLNADTLEVKFEATSASGTQCEEVRRRRLSAATPLSHDRHHGSGWC